jgi:L-glyceraldehyde 3-phosphate reductase
MKINDHAPFSVYQPNPQRYETMPFRRVGRSGVQLPAFSLGLWHNFSQYDSIANARQIVRTAFDLGITHFDLANNYGPPYGSAEETFRQLLELDLKPYRDEIFVSTKAGYDMWPGPYGNGGSRKYLVSSLDQSLKRMKLDYVDLFYHHSPDPNTPIEETVAALDHIVRQGKALYIGLSNYNAQQLNQALPLLKELGTPCLIQQSRYSLFDRAIEPQLLPAIGQHNIGMIAFSPLAQGMLTNKYLHGIPAQSRASNPNSYLKPDQVDTLLPKIGQLNQIAQSRGQSLAQMSLAWLLHDPRVSSVLLGASSSQQLIENASAVDNLQFTELELSTIRSIIEA